MLTAGFLEKETLLCSTCQCQWCAFSHHSQLQTINWTSLNIKRGTNPCHWLLPSSKSQFHPINESCLPLKFLKKALAKRWGWGGWGEAHIHSKINPAGLLHSFMLGYSSFKQ